MTPRSRMFPTLGLLLCLIVIGCNKRSPLEPEVSGSTITQLVARAGELPESRDQSSETIGTPEDSLDSNGQAWSCVTTRHYVAEASGEFPKFDPNTEVIWPGAALQGATITSPTPERVVAPRGGGTVILNNITGASISSVTVPEVTHATIINGANAIIAAQPSAFPARFTLRADQVRHSSELAVKLNANASFFGLFNSSASFGFDERDSYNRFLVQLNQSFYTLVFERPSSIDGFFAPSVTAADLDPFVGPGNPPVYVSSVTYGRVFYLLVESTDDAKTVEASVNASFLGIDGGGSTKHVSQLASVRIRAYALGGEAKAAFDAVRGGAASLDAFLDALKAGNDIATAVPLSYVVRSVLSDRLVRNAIAHDYTTRTCTVGSGPIIRFVASPWYLGQSAVAANVYELNVPRVNHWISATPNSPQTARADYQDPYGGGSTGPVRLRPRYFADVINGRGAVRFELGSPLFGRSYLSFLDFNAERLAGRDYTMMFVARYSFARGLHFGEVIPESCGVVVRGSSPSRGLGARFGFVGAQEVFCSQNDAPTRGQRPLANRSGFAVYTVVQSAARGSQLYINGSLVASDPSRTNHLTAFPGGMLGLVGASAEGPIKLGPARSQLDLAEAMFFDHGMSDVPRAQWEGRLARDYGLILTGITADLQVNSLWDARRLHSIRSSKLPAYR